MKEDLSQVGKKLDVNVNDLRTMQNWIEKYEPLKV